MIGMGFSSRRRGVRLLAVAALAAAGLAGVAAQAAASPPTHLTSAGGVDLGPNVYVFTPSMAQSDIQAAVDGIAAQQVGNQFGTERYSLLFEPGTYGTPQNPLVFQVGYYTEVAGLGQSPGDVVINGSIDAYNQCDSGSCIALNNFWRSLSNLTINSAGGSGCETNTEFWAVSQAASMRRVAVNGGMTFMDYCSGPSYASGGFVADSKFTASVVNGSQQQFIVRNSSVGGWSNGVWNQVFVGVDGAPAENFGPGITNPYTTEASAPVSEEKPYPYLDGNGDLAVFVPDAQQNSSGTTWGASATAGTSLPMTSFFVATPANTATQINAALYEGKNLLFTPGVYQLDKTIRVTKANTVVLGLGLATLVPTNGNTTMMVAGQPHIELAGLIFDAGTINSPALLNMVSSKVLPTPPDLVSDVYFRVGGATPGKVTTAAIVGASNVVLDNVWAWRADHGNGVGWTDNTSTTGLKVTGSDVTAYGLFVEHFQGVEVAWNGPNGKVFMFQNEMPYDVPNQAAWMSGPLKHGVGTVKGFPAIRVGAAGSDFHGYGLGSYCFFNVDPTVHSAEAFLLVGSGATMHDMVTVSLNGDGIIDSVVNGEGAPTPTPDTTANFFVDS